MSRKNERGSSLAGGSAKEKEGQHQNKVRRTSEPPSPPLGTTTSLPTGLGDNLPP